MIKAPNSVIRDLNGTVRPRMAHSALSDLCALAANGLAGMLDPDTNLFCYRLNQTPQGLVREGLSPRYTAMCLLGLYRLEAAGRRPLPFESLPIDTAAVFDALLADLAWVDNLGDLGLLLWLCAVTRPGRLEEICTGLDVNGALNRFSGARKGLTMELAWFLSGLSHAAIAGGHKLPDLPALAARTFSLVIANQGKYGTFGHLARSGSAMGALRGRIGSFADQVYPIYALATFGEAFQSRAAVEHARNCAEAICEAQGPLGQWWWHYDSLTGKVFQRYPVYSVHQHGMAPLALFALADVAGLDFTRSIYKGLDWIYGDNEMALDLRDTSSNLVWRSAYRRNAAGTYVKELADFLRGAHGPVPTRDLAVKRECRPYELGWLLYAFAGRSRD
jgi:hypothetical protein